MKIYNSKEEIREGKKVQCVYVDGILQKTFDIRSDNFVEDHNDFIESLIDQGHRTEKSKDKLIKKEKLEERTEALEKKVAELEDLVQEQLN